MLIYDESLLSGHLPVHRGWQRNEGLTVSLRLIEKVTSLLYLVEFSQSLFKNTRKKGALNFPLGNQADLNLNI